MLTISTPFNKNHFLVPIFGALLWLVIFFQPLFLRVDALARIEAIFMLSPLVIVPLVLPLIPPPATATHLNQLYYWLGWLQPVGALLGLLSFFSPQGLWAGLLAAGWVMITALLALFGFLRFWVRRTFETREISLEAGLMFIVVGGGWLLFARGGMHPLGFDTIIVLLTAIHFHYAGFVAPLLVSFVGRRLADLGQQRPQYYNLLAWGIISGMPLVAAGITFSRTLAFVGTLIIASSLLLLSYTLCFVIAPTVSTKLTRILLYLAGVSIVVGMGLAATYAFAQFRGTVIITIPQMVLWHGLTNACGFSLCSLLAWRLVSVNPD